MTIMQDSDITEPKAQFVNKVIREVKLMRNDCSNKLEETDGLREGAITRPV